MSINWELLKKNKKKKKKLTQKIIIIENKRDYERYLTSKRWNKRKKAFWKKFDKVCFCCNDKATEIHHNNYKWIGEEEDKDLVPLCRKCHEEIHDMVFREECKLIEAHKIYKKLLCLDILR